MATVKLSLDTRSAKKDGTYPVKLYVSHLGHDFFISTNISVKKEDWTGTTKEPTRLKNINAILIQILVRTQAFIYKLRAEGKLVDMDMKTLRRVLSICSFEEVETLSKSKALVVDYINEFIARKDRDGTKSVYRQTVAKLGTYYDLKVLTFEDINFAWLREFEQKMKEDGLSINTISIHMRNLRSAFNNAIDEELLEQNLYPFRKFKIKTERTVKRSLTVDQLRLLKNYQCEDHQIKYRDMFMLIFYFMGINMVDLVALEGITNGRIEFRRAKTGRLYSMKVEPEAMEIIERYRGTDFLINICDNYGNYKDFLHRMNKNLQEIGPFERVGRGGKKVHDPLFPSLTTYWARHTWATIAASLDIPKETIAEALGHGGNSVTDIYINFDQRKVDQANRKVIDYLEDCMK